MACTELTIVADSLDYPAAVEHETALAQQPAMMSQSSQWHATGAIMVTRRKILLTVKPMLARAGMLDPLVMMQMMSIRPRSASSSSPNPCNHTSPDPVMCDIEIGRQSMDYSGLAVRC